MRLALVGLRPHSHDRRADRIEVMPKFVHEYAPCRSFAVSDVIDTDQTYRLVDLAIPSAIAVRLKVLRKHDFVAMLGVRLCHREQRATGSIVPFRRHRPARLLCNVCAEHGDHDDREYFLTQRA